MSSREFSEWMALENIEYHGQLRSGLEQRVINKMG
jgi:hypothetical protein